MSRTRLASIHSYDFIIDILPTITTSLPLLNTRPGSISSAGRMLPDQLCASYRQTRKEIICRPRASTIHTHDHSVHLNKVALIEREVVAVVTRGRSGSSPSAVKFDAEFVSDSHPHISQAAPTEPR